MSLEKHRYIVEGLVQGVGYRFFAYHKAIELNIKGYAKNLMNGSVEIVAIGTNDNLSLFKEELKRGPMKASVTNIKTEEFIPGKDFESFEIY